MTSSAASDIRARYSDGWPIRWIAAEMGRSYGYVRGQLREAGVSLRPRGGTPRLRKDDPGNSPFSRFDDFQLVALVRKLLRPGFRPLIFDSEARRIQAWFGTGLGRLTKSTVPAGANLRRILASALGADPLMLMVNQEGGRFNGLDWPDVTLLPGAMALGASGDPELAREVAVAVAEQLRALGVAWNLAPVCDLYGPDGNPALGTRSFGSDPERVAALVAAWVKGTQAAGVAATAKHFPGLGGGVDPHTGISAVKSLPGGALLPFQEAISAQVGAVMVGSQSVADIDPGVPALFSPKVVEDLLRDRLGFTGVVVTENLSIPAVIRHAGGIGEAAVRAIEAGADLLLLDSEIGRRKPEHAVRESNTVLAIRREAVVAAVMRAVETGRLTRERLAASVRRVDALTARFAISDPGELLDEQTWQDADRRAAAAALRVARSAVTVVRADADALPLRLSPSGVVGVVRIPPASKLRADTSWRAPFTLPNALQEHHARVQFVDVPEPGDALPAATSINRWEAAVVVTHNGCHSSADHLAVARKLSAKPFPIIHLATGDPVDLAESPAQVTIASYSPDPASIRSVAHVLFGARATGILPFRSPVWDKS
ncbi:glycoside hydrolase family 3 N-terminal domain-containing protein [Micromonospora sp. FIMYZ51]|uniref:glycoside hydrolase family 3 N-terminal domain-containing protein n=1 Tax=Micromonospora sp. FIMYZ51 TaxID=3051832 RepID=UPI00311DF03E